MKNIILRSKFHFVGIGGIGMSGLAEVLHNMGAQVCGSDLGQNEQTERLTQLGVKIFKGHKAENLDRPDVVVYSSAVPIGNPELQKARALKIPMIQRGEALAEIMRLKRGIAISGTHGKTTTTSLISSLFLEEKLDPTIVIGGRLDIIKSNALLGSGEWLITEADESDGSFQKLSPEVAVITNVGADHLDYFKTFENVQKAFYDFALKIPFYGFLVVYGDDPLLKKLFENYPKKIIFYGFQMGNDYRLEGEKGKYIFFKKDEFTTFENRFCDIELCLAGRHNGLNALAATAVADQLGIKMDSIKKALSQFQGVDRRFHFKGEAKGIKVYDDYGHHPTEIKVTLEAFKEKFPQQRLIVYFQPHRYSRTQALWYEFIHCFSLADSIFLVDIYPASEEPLPGIRSERLANEMKHDRCYYFSRQDECKEAILKHLMPGDIFLTLGAGDGYKLGMEILEGLKV